MDLMTRCSAPLPWVIDGETHIVRCDEPALPNTAFCAEHYIDHLAPKTSAAGKRIPPDAAPAADPHK